MQGNRDLGLVTTHAQRTLWEAMLPPGYQDLPAELSTVDALLADPVFFEPYRDRFSPVGQTLGPIETYLRMMYVNIAAPWSVAEG